MLQKWQRLALCCTLGGLAGVRQIDSSACCGTWQSDALLYTVQTLDRGARESHSLTKRCVAEMAVSDAVRCRR